MVRSMLGTVAQFEREVIENVYGAVREPGRGSAPVMISSDMIYLGPIVSLSIQQRPNTLILCTTNTLSAKTSPCALLAKEKGFRGKRDASHILTA